MTRPLFRPLFAMLAVVVLSAAAPISASAHDYPTAARVQYVQACMREHPGPQFESLSKCSCALDAIARHLRYDAFVTMSTATNANTIGGERGSYIRDVDSLQKQIREFKQLQARAQKGCFIDTDTATR